MYTEKIGTDNCDGDESDETGTWSWKDNEKTIHLLVSSDTVDLTLINISSVILKVSVPLENFDVDGDGKDDSGLTLITTLLPR